MSDDVKSYFKKNGWQWYVKTEEGKIVHRPTHWKYGASTLMIPRITVHHEQEDKKMTNGAAIGYAIIAAKWIGLTDEQIKKLDRAMYEAMDKTTEEHAEKVYQTT